MLRVQLGDEGPVIQLAPSTLGPDQRHLGGVGWAGVSEDLARHALSPSLLSPTLRPGGHSPLGREGEGHPL